MKKLTLAIALISMLTLSACYPFIKGIPEQSILAGTVNIEISE